MPISQLVVLNTVALVHLFHSLTRMLENSLC